MVRNLLIALALIISVPAFADGDDLLFYSRSSGLKVRLKLNVPLADLRTRLREDDANNFILIWAGVGSVLREEHILRSFESERSEAGFGFVLQSGAVVALDTTWPYEIKVNFISAVAASSIFSYAAMMKECRRRIEGMLFSAGDVLGQVDIKGINLESHFTLDSSDSSGLTFAEMLTCDRELAGAKSR